MTLFAPLVRPRAESLENPEIPLSSERIGELFDGASTTAGPVVTEKKALGIPAVWRAVNLIAGTIASLPLHAYRSDGEVRKLVSSGWSAELLEDPHDDLTQMELLEIVMAHALLWGNAYLWKVRPKRASDPSLGLPRIEGLLPIHPGRITPGRTREGKKVYRIDGVKTGLTDYEILHIPGFGFDGIAGLSAIKVARQSLGLAMAAEEFGSRLFSNGALSTGILQTDSRLTQDQADALHKRWSDKRAGLSKAFGTIVLDSGLKYQQLTIPPEDAQFLETRSFQVSEIARWYGVPPHMLMDTDKSTSWGTGIEQQSMGFLVFTLRPWLTRLEQRFTRIIRPEKVYARFAIEGLLRADSAQRAQFYRTMWELGAFSTNDILALEERPPVEGGDVRYRPLNFGVLGTTDSPTTQEAAA